MKKLFFSLVASLFLLGACEKKVVCSDKDWTPGSVISSPEDAGPYPEDKLKKASYKDEYKRHVEMIDSICKDENPCSGSLGFAETFNHQNASKPHLVEDLWHKDILITIP